MSKNLIYVIKGNPRASHKYFKRVQNPNSKGGKDKWLYYYNQKEWDDAVVEHFEKDIYGGSDKRHKDFQKVYEYFIDKNKNEKAPKLKARLDTLSLYGHSGHDEGKEKWDRVVNGVAPEKPEEKEAKEC